MVSGASTVSTFARSGNLWVAKHRVSQETPHGECIKRSPLCNVPTQVFVDDRRLRRVTARAEVTANHVFIDFALGEIWIAEDPTGRLVEVTMAKYAFEGFASDVSINNLVVEKFKNPAQHGAIDSPKGARWTVAGVEARWNSGAGLGLGTEGKILGSHIHNNGQIGVVMDGRNVVLANNEIAFNNTHGFDFAWEGGGVKIAESDGVEMSGNFVHHNVGPGLWCDINCRRVVYEDNTVEHNHDAGIFHEISFDAVIRNNVVGYNGRAGRDWFWRSEIQIAASENVEVTNNAITVADGGRAIMLIDQGRPKENGAKYKTRNNWIHRNTIRFEGDGEAGGVSDVLPGNENAGIISSGGNRFDYNSYMAERAGAKPRFVWGDRLYDWWQFQALGNELNGVLTSNP